MIRIPKRRAAGKPIAIQIDPQLRPALEAEARKRGIAMAGATNLAVCRGLGLVNLIPPEFQDPPGK